MKEQLKQLLEHALARVAADRKLELPPDFSAEIERTRDNTHGEFASNVAMQLTRLAGVKPRDLAQEICAAIPASAGVDKVEVAGPGFINFFLKATVQQDIIRTILETGEQYGRSAAAGGRTVLIEFVSANPTGPLHIGHGRGAAYGDALGNLLAATGHRVSREYYVNDAGRQMEILTISILLRYLELCGRKYPFPANAYQGDYINDIAGKVLAEHGEALVIALDELIDPLWPEIDPDEQVDLVIAHARVRLGAGRYGVFHNSGLSAITRSIRSDLQAFGVAYDDWFSEQSLTEDGTIDRCIDQLRETGDIYQRDGAMWFNSTKYGDEKDRVVVRENGQKTYFASDIAYHHDKFAWGYDVIIDIWGADHHGYISRVRGSLQALGHDTQAMKFLLVQFATLYRGGEKIQMSTRSGQYVTLKELIDEVGVDAARFFYVTRRSEQHLDFDLDLARSQSNDNPVYYIQYVHARICSVMQQLADRKLEYSMESALGLLDKLVEPEEIELSRNLSKYPEVVQSASDKYEPHQVCFYLREVANDFHGYYNNHQILVDDDELRQARISMVLATRQVIRNGLHLIGVTAPEKM